MSNGTSGTSAQYKTGIAVNVNTGNATASSNADMARDIQQNHSATKAPDGTSTPCPNPRTSQPGIFDLGAVFQQVLMGDYTPENRTTLIGTIAEILVSLIPGVGTIAGIRDLIHDISNHAPPWQILLGIVQLIPEAGVLGKIGKVLSRFKGAAKIERELAEGLKEANLLKKGVAQAQKVALKAGAAAAAHTPKKSKKLILELNRYYGRLKEMEIREKFLRRGYEIIGEHVTIKTLKTNRIADILVRSKSTGRIVAIEVKSGGATRSARQIAKDNSMRKFGGKIIGKNGGQHIGETHKIKTIVAR